MNTFAKIGLAAAAVVVAALLGYTYLNAPNVGGPGMDDPTPSPSASVAPEAMPLPSTPASLDAGAYRATDDRVTPVPIEFDVPAGWSGAYGAVFKNADAAGRVGLEFWIVTHVYQSACQVDDTQIEIGPTSDDLVEALLAQEDIVAVAADETIGGYPAQRVDLSSPLELDVSTCREPGLLQVWLEETGPYALDPDQTGSVYVVDVDGERVVVTTHIGGGATDEDVAEVEALVGSIRFPTEP